jgi:hypothetical protein
MLYWSADGRELVYSSVPGGVAGVDLEGSGSPLRVGSLKTLVATPIRRCGVAGAIHRRGCAEDARCPREFRTACSLKETSGIRTV